ncbi:hypothetical protein BC829DRAFT_416628 [Chytridium lagenaria]|nr:hypothetical protein BC829DRAFT_416628 [Chytridium lagenaria]
MAHKHLVQFYDTVDVLYQVLSDVFAAALVSGDGVFMASTMKNIHMVQARLQEKGFDPAALAKSGAFSFIDSKVVLSNINPNSDDEIKPDSFFTLADATLLPKLKSFPKVVIFGDIVNTLCGEGPHGMHLAKDLEELWNDLQTRHDFTLICGYDMKNFDRECTISPFQALCGCHDHASPLEPTYPSSVPSDTQILLLEQRVKALTFELEARKTMEQFVSNSLRVISQKAKEDQNEMGQCFGHVISQLPVGLVLNITKVNGDKCVMANKMFLDMMGCTEKEALGEEWTSRIDASHRERVQNILHSRESATMEYCIGDGSTSASNTRWFSGQTHVSTFLNHTAFVHSVWEVTDLKRLEAEKSLAKIRELMQTQRLEDAEEQKEQLNQFIDSLCHELRNPINGILGNVDLLQSVVSSHKTLLPALDDEGRCEDRDKMVEYITEQEECIAAIKACASHSKVVADDILALSKLDANKIGLRSASFYPKVLLAEVALMLGARGASRGVKILVNVPDDNDMILGDCHRVRQVLINLVSNAITFTENGRITLAYNVVEYTKDTKQPKTMKFTVEDTGVGMTGGRAEGIVPAFHKKLVELMGGSISVSSVKGKGSIFAFTLSASADDVPTIPDTTRELDPPPSYVLNRSSRTSQERLVSTEPITTMLPKLPKLPTKVVQPTSTSVLIVEDNTINQKVLQKLLTRIGYTVLLASDGIEALEMYRKHSTEISVILMDIQIPRLSGMAATQEIRRIEQEDGSSRVRIVGISGNAREEIIDAAMACGMDGYLTKPWMKEDVFKVMGHEIEVVV